MKAFYSVAVIAGITRMFTVLDYLRVVRVMRDQETDAYKTELLTLLISFLNICSESYLN